MSAEVHLVALEYLVALARERHFGRAAAACHVSQPTLSVAIRKLEHDLGVPVVLRGRRFEGFTDEGARILTWAHRILAERDELLADVERMRGGLTMTARIAAIPTSIPASPLLSAELLRQHPSASIRVEALSSREIARRLADFEIDAGLTYLDDESPPGCRQTALYREHYVLLAPQSSPVMSDVSISWAAAATLPLCALTPEMRNRRIINAHMAAAGVDFAPVVEADTVGAIFAHLLNSEFATIASHAWLHAFGVPDGMAVRPMSDNRDGPTVGVITLARAPESPVSAAVHAAAVRSGMSATLEEGLARWLTIEPG
ncbi:LysR family transcriptional regulator [Mycobacterium sp. SMC-4]|uniref:LysR family transcriptional regulator n=1 Tax=Mycobacterium sp. SMC-4 TaxID=2857059 RepID=UPI0021B43E7E|nr:LysR family transcriptional regulator [Mycobacterium sp. SMC-4]UXA20444.1 LysR family transcriptional regulator [Mycobacterium sp. SMC-4]